MNLTRDMLAATDICLVADHGNEPLACARRICVRPRKRTSGVQIAWVELQLTTVS